VGEIDEMALAGIISVMLLHEQFIANPRTAAPAMPTRIVVGSKMITPDFLYHDQTYEESTTPAPA
jgi:hypothetical protein